MTQNGTAGGPNRRRQERFTLRKPVTLHHGGKRYAGNLRDISAGGAAVRVRAPVAVEAAVRLDMGDLGAFDAVVVRLIEDSLLGFRFEADAAALAELGRRLIAVFHGIGADEGAGRVDKSPLVP